MKTTLLLNHSIFASDEHLFYNCEIKRSFWVELRSWLTECNINLEPLSVVYVFFLVYSTQEKIQFVNVNHLILGAKFYTYHCKLINVINVINVNQVINVINVHSLK